MYDSSIISIAAFETLMVDAIACAVAIVTLYYVWWMIDDNENDGVDVKEVEPFSL
jgi:hypothetical protein